ncbi:MAG: pyrroline-5-carboxylate reductase [Fibrobacteres bacterium]|nr:pyrroline-5-carboxylate reductase [Fibrobacterota bacterium]
MFKRESEGILLIIGCGNMGGALALGLKKGLFDRVLFYDIETSKASSLAAKTGGESVLTLKDALIEADVVLLAVKPQSFPKLMAEAASCFRNNQIVVSIMAGVTIKSIAALIPVKTDIVRAMPNTPALVGEGLTAICGASEQAMGTAESLFSGVGRVMRTTENSMDSVTAISGSGPAYLFYYAEAMLKAAAAQGFNREDSNTLVYQTIKGAVKLLLDSGEEPELLRKKVTSPGGVTEAAVAELKDNGFEELIAKAIDRGVSRSKALGK